jgi:hypothetical protein
VAGPAEQDPELAAHQSRSEDANLHRVTFSRTVRR